MKAAFCILVVSFAFFSNRILCFSQDEGSSWFDNIDFEEYEPLNDYVNPKGMPPGNFLQIPCGIIVDGYNQNDASNVNSLRTRLDTSNFNTRISWNAVKANKDLLSLIVKKEDRYIIPSGALWLRMGSIEATVPSPEVEVVEPKDSDSFALNLGMDFLSTYQGIINLREGELRIIAAENDVMIPLLQSRSPSPYDDL